MRVQANTINVSTVVAMQGALKTAKKGDVIILANNTYSNTGLILMESNGIILKAASEGGVIFDGNSSFKISGSNNVLEGFQFKNVTIGNNQLVEVTGNYNLITQCNFYRCIAYHYVHFSMNSHHNELSYCNFEGKPVDPVETINSAVQLSISPTVAPYYKIHHCTFLNFPGVGGDQGNEPIRIGLGVEQNNYSGSIVEYCYFENTGLGDSETISLKSTYNIIRYNTFNNNPLGQLVFRTGNHNSAYGNFFINSGGIRIKEGGNHMVFNNYFEGAVKMSAIELANFKLNQKTKVGNALDTIYLYHNTFYKSGDLDFGGSEEAPPQNVIFANNLLYKETGTLLSNINKNVKYINNLFYGSASIGIAASANQFKNVPTALKLNTGGYYSLFENSPAINAAKDNYPAIDINPISNNDPKISLDIEGQPRPADKLQKDVGADEFTTAPILNAPLKLTQTGPTYLQGLTRKPDTTAVSAFIKPTSNFENDFFKVNKNSFTPNVVSQGTRVIVALSELKVKLTNNTSEKLARGEIKILKNEEILKMSAGEYFEIIVKKDHPSLTSPSSWVEPQKNKILYEDDQFRVFDEILDAGDTRSLHSHAQRVVVRLNEVKLTDPRFPQETLPGAGLQIPNTAKYADAVVHVVKNLSAIPLYNIVIEFKLPH